MRSFIVLALSLGLIGPYLPESIGVTSQKVPCVEIFKELRLAGLGLYHQGIKLEPSQYKMHGLDLLKLKKGSQIYVLGGGVSGRVFRIVSPSGRSHILKKYMKMDENERKDQSQQHYYRDKDYLERFRAASHHEPKDTLEVIGIQRAQDATRSLKLNDFQGFPIGEILDLLKESSPQKYAELVQEFNRRLDTFIGDLKAAGFVFEPVSTDLGHPTVHVYLMRNPIDKQRIVGVGLMPNVLFDPQTGRFMIVDPF